jgi:hypothetical protein
VAEQVYPGPLAGYSLNIAGTNEAPETVTVAWAPDGSDAHVFTHIPINHHAAGPTFTECTVPASAGGFVVEAPMLVPLAVVTGLEFQSVQHVRFAAANTAVGCVEFRLLTHNW